MLIAERLEIFKAAWDRKDEETLLTCFTQDATYHASVGPAPGEAACGRGAIRVLIQKMLARDSDTTAAVSAPIVTDNIAVWTWRYERRDGPPEIGCD
ncbi:MAG: nuclear transport factor 2 family protein, partial [Pseudomonadota bacterium]